MYNYYEAMKEDVKEYIENEVDLTNYDLDLSCDVDSLKETLNDELWIVDSVTGNESGSYTFNRKLAKEYVLNNMDLLTEACEEFCTDAAHIGEQFLNEDFEGMDVTIRCYLLNQIIDEVVENL